MLRWALIFLVIALVAALFGFTGIASARQGSRNFSFFFSWLFVSYSSSSAFRWRKNCSRFARRMAARWKNGFAVSPAFIPGAFRSEIVAAVGGTRAKVDGAIQFAPVSHAVRR